MPIYEYRCPKCGTFETTQRITEPALKRCPTCKSKVERMISATSFVLKGSGWYATDYARSGNSKSETADKPSTSSDSGSNGNNGSTAASSSSDKSATSDKSASSSSEKSKPAD